MKILKMLNKIEEFITVLIMVFVLAIMAWQVIARSFHMTNAWSEELTRYLCFGLVFFASSYAIKEEAHIKIDGLLGIYPEKIKIFVVLLGYVALFVYCLFITVYGIRYTKHAFRMGQIAPSLGGFPMWVFFSTLPIAHVFMAFRSVEVFIRIIKRKSYKAVSP